MAKNTDSDDDPNGSGDEYRQEGYELPPDGEDGDSGRDLSQAPAVSAGKSRHVLIAVAGGVLMLFLLYQVFIAEDTVEVPDAPPPPPISVGVAPQETAPVIQAPNTEVLPPPPPPPPPPNPWENDPYAQNGGVPPNADPNINFENIEPNNEQLMARRRSSMLIAGQGGNQEEQPQQGNRPLMSGLDPSNPNASWANSLAQSEASRAVATHVGDLNRLVLQGKIVHAVLETAIDSTLPGTLRAVVARDVYAEAGYDVLIPKGSRLIGSYNTDIVRGQARIFVIWNRLIRPDGVDVQVSSPSVDRLGRSGIAGFVDNRYFEIFSGALLTSTFTIGTAALGEALLGTGQVTTTTNQTGQPTTTGSPTDLAFSEAMTNISGVAERILTGLLDVRPQITVDQGTPVNVFVNQDLEFPPGLSGRFTIIP